MTDITGQFAENADSKAKALAPIDTGELRRKRKTGSVGFPVWLHDLMVEAGWDGHVGAIEIGGRGVLHPEAGWVSVDELRELADG